MKLMELAGLVKKNDRGKKDVEVKSGDLQVNESGELICDGRTLKPNDWAWYSLFAKASKGTTTKRYLHSLPVDQWSRLVNTDLQNSDQKWVLRTRGSELLGVVSANHYRAYNNSEVVKALIQNLGCETPVHRFHLNDRLFFVRTLYPDGGFKVGAGDTYRVGFTSINSEVGFRSLANSAFIFRLVCTNDAQMMQHTSMKFRHVAGHSFEEITGELGRSIEKGRHLKTFYVDLVTRAMEDRIPDADTERVLEYVRELLQTSKKRTKEIAALYTEEPRTRLGLVNAITLYAQRLEGEPRFQLESGAGSLLETAIPAGRG